MIRNLKLFASCVESMRKAEREYQVRPTPANKKIMEDLRNKVDGWVKWIKDQEEAELSNTVPPFVARSHSSGHKGVINHNLMQQLAANHTPEEIERFFKSIQGL